MVQVSKHFKDAEFACKCGKCGLSYVNPNLIIVLEDVREHFGQPVIITSGRRCVEHNKAVGGAPASKHVTGDASDIKVKNVSPNDVADYLEKKYPNEYGIGRYNTFTHVDVRPTKARWDFRK